MEETVSSHFSPAFWYIVGGLLLAVSLAIRVVSYPVITSDYTYFVAKWFAALAAHAGLSSFSQPFADYAPLYLYLLKLLTFIPVSSLYSAKTLSVLFDLLLAGFACAILRWLSPERFTRARLFCAFVLMLSIPTLVINSSLWGQSDALFAAAVVASAYFILADRPRVSAIAFAIGFCIKVQSLFFLPVLVGYLAARGQSRQLWWIPGLYTALLVPAWLSGGNLWYWLTIYATQAGEYTGLTINAPSAYALVSSLPQYGALFWAGIALALLAAVTITVLVARITFRRAFHALPLLFLLSVAVLPFLLPRMHERYFYLADVFSVLYGLYRPWYWYVPILVVGASFLSYMPYLSAAVPAFSAFIIDERFPAALMLLALVALLMPFAYGRYTQREGRVILPPYGSGA